VVKDVVELDTNERFDRVFRKW